MNGLEVARSGLGFEESDSLLTIPGDCPLCWPHVSSLPTAQHSFSAERRMDAAAPPGSKDRQGVHLNTADCDCAHCAADLWLSAVVSPAAPGVAFCPEHAGVSLG